MHEDSAVTLFVMVVGFLATIFNNRYDVSTLRNEMKDNLKTFRIEMNTRFTSIDTKLTDLTNQVSHFVDLHIEHESRISMVDAEDYDKATQRIAELKAFVVEVSNFALNNEGQDDWMEIERDIISLCDHAALLVKGNQKLEERTK